MKKCNGRLFNKQNTGITLIALIITIIILLILAGVTIHITLGNNGIINKAKFASDEYQKHNNEVENIEKEMNSFTLNMENQDYIGQDINYTGEEEKITIKRTGIYKLEVWGAQGGNFSSTYNGGYGAYSVGEIKLYSGQEIFVNVGGCGTGDGGHSFRKGGYNGGGNANSNGDGNTRQASGGGATHIATVSGTIDTLENNKDKILIIAGGGGGAGANSVIMAVRGGAGGGICGNDSEVYTERSWTIYAKGATQTDGNAFGQGGSHISSGGGGGLYGGYAKNYCGAGGSGYIGNPELKNKHMAGYEVTTSNDEDTKTISVTEATEEATEDCAKKGDGFARITFLYE